ncbi:hypothetical protein [Kitasatospora cineracea]|uniref:Uncharacterized protein n=1 Tax=Kitasatospora cineracea TaxID=88074 RepID=A0A8G1UFM7_9ACTN|nr:hypothetical protein [Kitasatospora cineracea]ROR43120.1 hypothetical protein EDD39_1261 [Kitasatospora cineracea]
MGITPLTAENSAAFLARFGHFEDGVITGIRLHLPRGPITGREAAFDIQAVDTDRGDVWRLVRLTLGGVHEYLFPCSDGFSYFVLSDGLNLDVTGGRCVLDLDPGPDAWSPEQVGRPGAYAKQYAVGERIGYEVLDGPFI